MLDISGSQGASIIRYRAMKQAIENRLFAIGWFLFAVYGMAMLAYAQMGWVFEAVGRSA